MSRLGPDQALCLRYAQFASGLENGEFDFIYTAYWLMSGVNVSILFMASWIFIKAQQALEHLAVHDERRERVIWMYLLLGAGCISASAALVVMEAFALLALQFCDGEALITLYWSSWTVIQVGSLVAMMGITLGLTHSLRGSKHPPWALALGTPVLVIAGTLHMLHDVARKAVQRLQGSPPAASETSPCADKEQVMESARKDARDDRPQAELIGVTVDGGPIMKFMQPLPPSLRRRGELLGHGDKEEPIMAYRNGLILLAPEPESDASSMGSQSYTASGCPSINFPDLGEPMYTWFSKA
ncbi:hypothetical protein CDD83_7085 [Cordyceps sp. RAO-2017]|nr:hypothetical protein CDD83_7085 [Cordyceps sp. RAO-2017]